MKIAPFARKGNFTGIDNYVLDYIMPNLSPNGWKVLCFIIRNTKGWRKDSKQLTYKDIRTGTGIASDATLNKSVVELVAANLIIITTKREYEGNFYGLNSSLEIEVQEDCTTENEVQDDSSATETKVLDACTTVFDGTGTTENVVQEQAKTDDFTPTSTLENEAPKESIKITTHPTGVAVQPEQSFSEQIREIQTRLEKAKPNERQPILLEAHELCFGKNGNTPTYSYIGKVAREVGGAGLLVKYMVDLVARPPVGDKLAYISQMHKAKKQGKVYANGVSPPVNWQKAFDNQDVPEYIRDMQAGGK